MRITHHDIDFVTPDGTISTVVGECDDFAEAHDLIMQHVQQSRENIKAAWEKHFDFPWPGYTKEITLTQKVIKGTIVIIVNSAEADWYEVK